ncbi:DNA-binding SARP family transcriptional activator [Catenulispora sp. GAS73]
MTATEFRVLGAIEAVVGGRPTEVGHARQRAVLAVLLAQANRVVTPDQVVDRVWGRARVPEDPRGTLRTYVSLLRRSLVTEPDVEFVHEPSGYKVVLDEQRVDLYRFHGLLAQARADGSDDRSAALLEEALRLWRGEPYTGLDTPWSNSVRQNLLLQRYSARLDLTDVQLRLGRHAELLAELTAEADEHSLDERIAAQLMLALYRCGRTADALARYQRIRGHLAAELGSDPGPQLRRLHMQILNADSALAAPPPGPVVVGPVIVGPVVAGSVVAGPSHPGRAVAVRQLPAAPRLFVGRQAEVAQLTRMLGEHGPGPHAGVRVAVIDGMPGIGKTALALRVAYQVADRFPDGQLFIDLRAYTEGAVPRSPADALGVLLRALGAASVASVASAGALTPDLDVLAAAYRDRLAGTRTLIVLDNVADESQVRPLLPGGGDSAVLVTSRRRLKALDDAVSVPLGTLPPAEATELLRQAARGAGEPAEDVQLRQGAELCAGLPLAVVIGGALLRGRGRAASLPWLIDRLSSRPGGDALAGFTDGDRRLSAVFGLSYRSLSEDARTLFRRLTALPRPEFDTDAVAALMRTDLGSASVLAEQLADHNLLTADAPGRFRIHRLLLAYAGTFDSPSDPQTPAVNRLSRDRQGTGSGMETQVCVQDL